MSVCGDSVALDELSATRNPHLTRRNFPSDYWQSFRQDTDAPKTAGRCVCDGTGPLLIRPARVLLVCVNNYSAVQLGAGWRIFNGGSIR
jgi:hypothetical protein